MLIFWLAVQKNLISGQRLTHTTRKLWIHFCFPQTSCQIVTITYFISEEIKRSCISSGEDKVSGQLDSHWDASKFSSLT